MEYTGDYINNVLHICPRGKYTLLGVIFLQYSRLTARVLKEYNPSKAEPHSRDKRQTPNTEYTIINAVNKILIVLGQICVLWCGVQKPANQICKATSIQFNGQSLE